MFGCRAVEWALGQRRLLDKSRAEGHSPGQSLALREEGSPGHNENP